MPVINNRKICEDKHHQEPLPILVAICVATFRRPKGLAMLLSSLCDLNIENLHVHLIVADNDAEGSANRTVDDWRDRLHFPVTYVVEPARGIVSVRNRLVDEARNLQAEYISFVDDDETVDPWWLHNLLAQSLVSHADAVAGPQIFQFDDDIPEYVRSGLELKQFPNGTPVGSFSTGNVLIRTTALAGVKGPFDSRFNLTGGSDVFLAATLSSLGFKIVYCREAVVYELVPKSRSNMGWIFKRGFRVGTVLGRMALNIDPSATTVARHIVRSLGRVVLGSGSYLLSLLFKRDKSGRYVRQFATGLGGFAILLTPRAAFQEYKTIHGE